MSSPRLSLVVPIHDEAAILATNLARMVACLEPRDANFELVCVDDGSTDGSAALLDEAAAADSRIRVERLARRRGKGAAVRRGILAASGERVLCVDADLSTDLSVVDRALALLDGGAPLVLGDRHIDGACVRARQSWIRERLGRVFAALARASVDGSVSDFTCGFRGFRSEAARNIFSRVRVEGWAFDAEVIAIAGALSLAPIAIPVTWTNRENTRVRLPADGLRALLDLAAIAWRARAGRYR